MKRTQDVYSCDACGKTPDSLKFSQTSKGEIIELCEECFRTLLVLECIGMRSPITACCDGCGVEYQYSEVDNHFRLREKRDAIATHPNTEIKEFCPTCLRKNDDVGWDKRTWEPALGNLSSRLTVVKKRK